MNPEIVNSVITSCADQPLAVRSWFRIWRRPASRGSDQRKVLGRCQYRESRRSQRSRRCL